MSSSQQTSLPQDLSDKIMMEAPDSPPEIEHSAVDPSSSFLSSTESQYTNHQANTSRSKGEDNAKVNHGAPGSTWSSKKFHDEYERAMGSLLDQNWDPSKYSDPLYK